MDVLVNNAGVIEVGPAETMSVADYEEAMATNFWGMLYPTLAVLPEMRARRSGRVVNITSIGGKLGIPHLLPVQRQQVCRGRFLSGAAGRGRGRRHQGGDGLSRPHADRQSA